MNENEMGYRGSKSGILSVKEQRVDGSWCINPSQFLMHLRCTLMGFERNYQIKIPSKQLNKLFISTVSGENTILNPYFITGFADAESSFCTTIEKNVKLKTGYRVRAFWRAKLD